MERISVQYGRLDSWWMVVKGGFWSLCDGNYTINYNIVMWGVNSEIRRNFFFKQNMNSANSLITQDRERGYTVNYQYDTKNQI